MQHVDKLAELHGVDGAVRVPFPVLNHLHHTCAAEAKKHLGVRMLAADLGEPQTITNTVGKGFSRRAVATFVSLSDQVEVFGV